MFSQQELLERDYKLSLILQEMEFTGIKIDPTEARLKAAQCAALAQKIIDELGYDPAKPAQLAKRLYGMPPDGLGLKPTIKPSKTTGNITVSKSFPNGRPAMGVAELEQHFHPEVGKVLEFRRIIKAKTSYYDTWPKLADENDRIHPTYHQHSTVTGRFSCSDPNMQQIPRDSDENEVKRMFPVKKLVRAEPGWDVYELDYDQQELRLISIYADCTPMLDIFRTGGDPHQMMADRIGVSRFLGKQCNFLLPYGGGAEKLYDTVRKLAPSLGFTIAQAYNIHSTYHQELPHYRALAKSCEHAMIANGYISNWAGRRRRMKYDQHNAMNSLIQGGCGDITREAMLRIHDLKLKNTKMISQVHDSLWFETRDLAELELAKQAMEWPTEAFGLPFSVGMKKLT